MSPDENKSLVQRIYDDLFNQGRLRLTEEFIAETFVTHAASPGLPRGPMGVRDTVASVRAAFPDGRYVIEDLIAEGDRVVVRVTFSGTQAGMFRDIPATGRRVTIEQIHILRVADTRAVEHWAAWDNLVLLSQLGSTVTDR